MTHKVLKMAALVMLLGPLAAGATPILDGSGQLLGASNVDVGGTLYDVEFVDGRCATLFTGCDNSSDFTFRSLADAVAASQALLDQVFLGQFDTNPEFTTGCRILDTCTILTPWAISGSSTAAAGAHNWAGTVLDTIFTGSLFTIVDTTGNGQLAWALWDLSTPTSVPEPGTLILMALGLVGLSFGRKRTRPQVTEV